MNIEIGYFPKNYYDSTPDAGGYFPFALEGTTPYVLSMDGLYLPECDEDFLPLWMKNIKAFPLYFCAEIPSFYKDEYEYNCKKYDIHYKYLNKNKKFFVSVVKVQNEKQFRNIFPFYITLGSGNDVVLWSTNKDVFSVEKRDWKGNWEGMVAEAVVVKVEDDTSVFWIGYDGDNIGIISNQAYFSTYKNIIRTLPEFVIPKLCEYEEI